MNRYAATEGALGESLGKRLFNTRLELIGELDHRFGGINHPEGVRDAPAVYSGPKTNGEVRHSLAELLHRETAAMKLDNFVVRPRRRTVEKYAKFEAWNVPIDRCGAAGAGLRGWRVDCSRTSTRTGG